MAQFKGMVIIFLDVWRVWFQGPLAKFTKLAQRWDDPKISLLWLCHSNYAHLLQPRQPLRSNQLKLCSDTLNVNPLYQIKRFGETRARGQTRTEVGNHHHYRAILWGLRYVLSGTTPSWRTSKYGLNTPTTLMLAFSFNLTFHLFVLLLSQHFERNKQNQKCRKRGMPLSIL